MIHYNINGCSIDILPIVNGLVSEADKVKAEFGCHEAYAISLGIEGIEALKKREEIGVEDIEVSELDLIYSKKMAIFGDIQTPSPAFCELVDLCKENDAPLIPLDMNDYDYDTAFMECVKATEFTSVHHLAKKGYKKNMDSTSAEALALAWDKHVESVKGFARLNRRREDYIAKEIKDISRYRKSILCVIEVERIKGICANLEA